jgi:hypothetical protein
VIKKVLTLLVVGFAVFYLLTEPAAAADALSGAVGGVLSAFDNVTVFVQELLS